VRLLPAASVEDLVSWSVLCGVDRHRVPAGRAPPL